MPKKKQQTIEGTLGRPKLKAKPPKPRAAKASSSSTPKKDGTLEGSQSWFYAAKDGGTPRQKIARPPTSSFMPRPSTKKKATLLDSSSSSADEASSLDDDDGTPRAKPSPANKRVTAAKGGKKQSQPKLGSSPRSAVVVKDESSSEEDLPVPTPRVPRQARGKGKMPVAVADESEVDSDDKPLATPIRLKRPAPAEESDEEGSDGLNMRPAAVALESYRQEPARRTKRARSEDDEDSDEDIVVQSTKRRRLARKNGATVSSSPPPRSSPTKRVHRSEKDKRRELLRRRRAGEDITMEDLQTSEEEETRAALYDTDSDHVALEDFEDDEEGVPEQVTKTKPKSRKKRSKAQLSEDDVGGVSNDDDELSGFIAEDDDEKLGVPAEFLEMPIEFTRHSRKPLKEHFRDVVEWLVRFTFEPDFDEKHNELYLLGWRRLDDEVAALASSKFASSAWKPDFRRALNARPKFDAIELPRGDLDRLFSTCEACGRSGHPATWTITFHGNAYHRKNNKDARFLEDVESDEEEEAEESSSSSSSSPNSETARQAKPQRDEDGNELPPDSKQWSVGAVCKSNAETAHTLIHWKHNLLEWVGDRLENDGFMTAAAIAARARMKRKQRNKVVDDIIAGWFGERAIEDLYREFKNVLDDARNKSTTGRGGGRWGR
ncbi:hypothetical protein GE09DRAFT_1118174 [Coniochaeta sp. 2T2.1]|nr:hypothetical protein GE09DRAFT_1118174 [Coniochaeta sp. 2T2.1]